MVQAPGAQGAGFGLEIDEIAKRIDPNSVENTAALLQALSSMSLSNRYR